MQNRSPRHTAPSARQCIALAALLTLTLQPPNGWTQSTTNAPAQKPLVTRDGGQPKPNVMLTLDTSWSMIFPYVPEGAFTVNQQTVNFPGFTSPVMHPDDPRHDPGQQSTVAANQRAGDGGPIPADLTDNTNVFQRQMRSPDVNQLYYNPRLEYKPWRKPRDPVSGVERYPNAIPRMAWFDPDKISSTDKFADLTAATTTVNAIWCHRIPPAGGKMDCGDTTTARNAYLKSFSPAVYFLLNAGQNPNAVGSYTAYDINGGATTFTKYSNRADCLGATSCTQAEELQNYANWFVYYRTRLHVVQAAIPESFLQLDDIIRVGWGTIHQGTSVIDGQDTSIVQSGVRDFDTARKNNLVSWIRNFQSSKDVTSSTPQPKLLGGTPLLSALAGVGEYFSRKDRRSPWVNNPALTAGDNSTSLSCRRSYNMLITDGYYRDEAVVDNVDNTAGTEIVQATTNGRPAKTYTYAPARPFSDGRAGTLADVAMKYWNTDLQAGVDGLDNNVPAGNDTVLEDPAFWQHLVQFPIGLGVSGNIPLDDLSNQLVQLTRLGGKGWWDGGAVTSTDPRRIDDLLHAAVNSRGQYFSAKNAAELTAALTTALNRASERPGLKEAGVGAASLVLGAVNAKYVPEYTTTSWVGDIKSFPLNAQGVTTSTIPRWDAASKVPAPANRNIFTWTGTAGVAFNWETLGTANQAVMTPTLPNGATGPELVNYIRGDTSQEDSATSIKLFRKRAGKLPDFINSTPLLIKGNVNLRYETLPDGTLGRETYSAFASITKPARPAVLFVGGNGGMLHAFADQAGTNVVAGQEVFAYVPKTVLPDLSVLAQKDYGRPSNYHRYFVDGPLVESDVYLGGAWKNILVGTLGAGGKGIFALDVTNPTAMGATSVLWEKSSADEENMGYMTSAPQVGILPSGEWAVFVGNGTHSSAGKAALIMIKYRIADPARPQDVTLTVSSIEVSQDDRNGLGGVTLVKNGRQQVIGAYAGDLKGHVWRFDVSDTGVVSVGLNGSPLYTADDLSGTPQPITAAPAVMPHPNGGNFVIVGTGKLIDTGDNDNLDRQTLYGLWDKPMATGNSAFQDTAAYVLVQQTIDTTDRASGFFNLSANPVDYGDSKVLGWYIDLNIDEGQRVIYAPMLVSDYVFAGTMVPAKAARFCSEADGVGYNFLMPALTGGRSDAPILDTNGDRVVDNTDQNSSVYTTGADGTDTILIKENSDGTTDVSAQNTVDDQVIKLKKKRPLSSIIGRTWRQILNPPTP